MHDIWTNNASSPDLPLALLGPGPNPSSGYLSLHGYRKFLAQESSLSDEASLSFSSSSTGLPRHSLKRKPATTNLHQICRRQDVGEGLPYLPSSTCSSAVSSAPSSPPPLSMVSTFSQSVVTLRSTTNMTTPPSSSASPVVSPVMKQLGNFSSQSRRMVSFHFRFCDSLANRSEQDSFHARLDHHHTLPNQAPAERTDLPNTETAEDRPDNRPFLLNFHGTFFEILNPRDSLAVSNIESAHQSINIPEDEEFSLSSLSSFPDDNNRQSRHWSSTAEAALASLPEPLSAVAEEDNHPAPPPWTPRSAGGYQEVEALPAMPPASVPERCDSAPPTTTPAKRLALRDKISHWLAGSEKRARRRLLNCRWPLCLGCDDRRKSALSPTSSTRLGRDHGHYYEEGSRVVLRTASEFESDINSGGRQFVASRVNVSNHDRQFEID